MAKVKMTAAEAKLEVADQDRRQALKALQVEKGRSDRAKESARKARDRFEKAVALAVSSRPTAPDWYSHVGPLPQAQVREALGLSSMALHRIMDRYAKRRGKK